MVHIEHILVGQFTSAPFGCFLVSEGRRYPGGHPNVSDMRWAEAPEWDIAVASNDRALTHVFNLWKLMEKKYRDTRR